MYFKFKKSATAICMLTATSLSGCGGMNVWPFAKEKPVVVPGKPVGADEYGCDSGKKFYVRKLDSGDAVWLILPDREVALNKVSGAEPIPRYSNKITTLSINGADATLEISTDNAWKNCKLVTIKP